MLVEEDDDELGDEDGEDELGEEGEEGELVLVGVEGVVVGLVGVVDDGEDDEEVSEDVGFEDATEFVLLFGDDVWLIEVGVLEEVVEEDDQVQLVNKQAVRDIIPKIFLFFFIIFTYVYIIY